MIDAVIKGVQGTFGQQTQDFKDCGRVIKTYFADGFTAGAEAMVTLTPVTDGTTAATNTSFQATKRFRVTSLTCTTVNAGAAVQGVVVKLRFSNTGAVTTASPIAALTGCGTTAATASVGASGIADIPDGIEFSGSMQFGVSQVGTATAGNSVVLTGYEY